MFGFGKSKYEKMTGEELRANQKSLLAQYQEVKDPDTWDELDRVVKEMDRRFYADQERKMKEHPEKYAHPVHNEHSGIMKD